MKENSSPPASETANDPTAQALEQAFLNLLKEVEGRTAPMMDGLVRNEIFLKLAGGLWNAVFSVKAELDGLQEKRNELLNIAGKSSQDRILRELRRMELRLARIERRLQATESAPDGPA